MKDTGKDIKEYKDFWARYCKYAKLRPEDERYDDCLYYLWKCIEAGSSPAFASYEEFKSEIAQEACLGKEADNAHY